MSVVVTILCAAGLAGLLLRAAIGDWRERDIPNGLNLAIALVAPLWWLGMEVPFWPDAAIRVGLAVVVFLIAAGAFQLNMMGGGDVKMLTALALWFAPVTLLRLIYVMSFIGFFITLGFYIAWRRHKAIAGRQHTDAPPKPEIPYGIAIAIAGLFGLANDILTIPNH